MMFKFLKFNTKIFDQNSGGPSDIATQHAQIAAQKQSEEGEDKNVYKGLLSQAPVIGKIVDTASDAAKLLTDAPKIDQIVNLSKEPGQQQTGSLFSSINPGGLLGKLPSILGKQVSLKTEAYDPSILAGKAPSLNNQSESSSSDISSSGAGETSSASTASSSGEGDGNKSVNNDYALPNMSGVSNAPSFEEPASFSSKFQPPSEGSSFTDKISSESGQSRKGRR